MTTDNQHDLITDICTRYGNDKGRMLDILTAVQERLRCIDETSMHTIADTIGCSRIEVEGVVTFYSFFSVERKGDITIRLCDDIVDRFAGMKEISMIFEEELGIKLGQTSDDGRFSIDHAACIGMCDQAPAALINDVVITSLTPESARDIAQKLKTGTPPQELLNSVGDGNNAHELIRAMVNNNIRRFGEVLFDDANTGKGLKQALHQSPQDIIEQVIESGLRGCGGAGFPTGRKWSMAANTPATERYVICNADEGEPGTFKDRVLLTERAELVIEGMTIAARAIASTQGIIYLRGEYAYLKPYLEACLQSQRDSNFLGKNIGNVDGFDFDIRIQLGAGAYICGEESSLISSCEGLRGEPKNRPPYPVEKGYLDCPTLVNNVETFACIARIIERGAQWFNSIGTDDSSGTKLISISGDCDRPGVYELPYGTTVHELLKLAGAEQAAAVQVGGPSGQMIDPTAYGRKICFEDLPTGGAIIVFGSHRNILEIVEYYLDFFISESCGYCTPCRVGNVFLKERIGKIRKGFAELMDLDYLRELSNTVIQTSRCGLGQTSPKPVISSMDNFPLVYSALLKEHPDGMRASFDIQKTLEESRHLAKRRSHIFDTSYDN